MKAGDSSVAAEVPFWYWSNWLYVGTSRERKRTLVDLAIKPYDFLDRVNFGFGKIDATEVPPIEAEIVFCKGAEDCPWPVTSMFVVSDRIRRVLEASAPSNCQFFRINLWHHKQPFLKVYWVLYVDAVDCADPERSGRGGDGGICDPVIVEGRVPPDIMIFRIKGCGSGIVVRDALRRILEREQVTGCFFYEPPEPSMPWTVSRWLQDETPTPLAAVELESAEQALKCELPGDYREFVRQHNGGRLKQNALPVRADHDLRWAKNINLLPLVPAAGNWHADIVSSQDQWRPLLPTECIPIGKSPGDAWIVLYVHGPRRGEVWLRTKGHSPANPRIGVFYCAMSFHDAMESMESEPPFRAKLIE